MAGEASRTSTASSISSWPVATSGRGYPLGGRLEPTRDHTPADAKTTGRYASPVDFRDTPDEAEFRRRVRDWLGENIPAGWGRPGHREPEGQERLTFFKDWSRRLYDAGFVGVTWPQRYGGREGPLTHQVIALEEFARTGAPEHMGVIGIGMAGPTILAHGTEEQKDRYL